MNKTFLSIIGGVLAATGIISGMFLLVSVVLVLISGFTGGF